MSDLGHHTVADGHVVGAFPLTATQLRCWFLDGMQPGNPSLNVAVRWELRGPVASASIERAFQAVIDRHEILRTRFVERDGGPVQEVVDHVAFKLDTVDIRAVPAGDQQDRIDSIAHEVAARPFDLGRPGLIRATLIRLGAELAQIVYVVHQSCFDGASIRVLGHEIGTAAQAFEEGRQPELPELPLQYGDFALWQQDYFASGVLEDEAAYWTRQLEGAPYFEVEPDKPRPPLRATDVAQVTLDLPDDFDSRIAAAAQAAGVSPFTFGCALFSACLGRVTGRDDVLFGTQVAGRVDSDLDPMIGVFINNLVLRFGADPAAAFADHLARAKPVVEGAISHQSMPFNMLVERLNPRRDASRTPLISLNFNLQQVFMESRAYGGFELRSTRSHAPGAIYDLDVAVMGRPGGWQIMLDYATTLFDRETAEALARMLRDGFETVFADPTTPLGQLRVPAHLSERGQDGRRRMAAAEHALTSHPMVREAAVLAAGEALYAFVVPQATGTLPLERLPDRLMADLGPAAGLSGVSILADFPRSSTGAINRSVLGVPSAPRREAMAVRQGVLDGLRAEFAEVLGMDSVPPSGHFFDLGGHSVLVLRLLSRIRDRWGLQLEVTQVYEHSTPLDLAQVISDRTVAQVSTAPEEDWRIMRLRREGAGQPLIAVNNAATALALSTAGQAPRQTLCVRVNDGARGMPLDDRPFEEIAAEYARVIREAQPEGPYLLYGNCVHGNLALEAARHLRAAGAEVRGVVMKDVWEPGYTAALPSNPAANRQEKLHALKTRLRSVRDGEMTFGALLGLYSVTRRSGILQLGARLGLIDRVRKTDLEEDQERFISHVSRRRDAYRPGPVDFPVLHVVTGITPEGGAFSPSIGWEGVIPSAQLTTVRLPKVLVLRDRRIGITELSSVIEDFLGEDQAKT
ncbi:condensation domain-containing protein [Pseudooceanicola sp. LIPI14-2-Ac024]|uniref:condensation domain-containing protein n=1 Tax=Pseudooceanicola sp. LIPI14-2-Ac024 TaxID=3344875 RepID=UPI0035D0BDD8